MMNEKRGSTTPFSVVLYIVRQPYCDFMRSTYKINVLSPVHGMFKRQDNGFKGAQVNFRILPKSLLGEYSFNVVMFDKIDASTGIGKTILFKDLGTNNMTAVSFRIGTYTVLRVFLILD